jgi:hypothetical protein
MEQVPRGGGGQRLLRPLPGHACRRRRGQRWREGGHLGRPCDWRPGEKQSREDLVTVCAVVVVGSLADTVATGPGGAGIRNLVAEAGDFFEELRMFRIPLCCSVVDEGDDGLQGREALGRPVDPREGGVVAAVAAEGVLSSRRRQNGKRGNASSGERRRGAAGGEYVRRRAGGPRAGWWRGDVTPRRAGCRRGNWRSSKGMRGCRWALVVVGGVWGRGMRGRRAWRVQAKTAKYLEKYGDIRRGRVPRGPGRRGRADVGPGGHVVPVEPAKHVAGNVDTRERRVRRRRPWRRREARPAVSFRDGRGAREAVVWRGGGRGRRVLPAGHIRKDRIVRLCRIPPGGRRGAEPVVNIPRGLSRRCWRGLASALELGGSCVAGGGV